MNTKRILTIVRVGACSLCLQGLFWAAAWSCEAPKAIREAGPAEIHEFFAARKLAVLTFEGYSGAEYEDRAAMLKRAGEVLAKFDPKKTIVNIGATPEGVGAVYNLAKEKGFVTTGIVSTQAKDGNVKLAPCVDYVFYVKDASWGGFLEGTQQLSPTSTAMVENSDVLVGIGGGEVARDELTAAKRLGKDVRFYPADMNHELARDKAAKRGQPAPTDFRGAASIAFSGRK
jgi:hypothetical protein